MEEEKKEILGPTKKVIGIGAGLGIQHLTERLQRRYGEGRLTKNVLKAVEETAKKISNF